MNKSEETISLLHALMILLSLAGVMDHVIAIPMLLHSAGRDSWISVLAAMVFFIVWIGLIRFIIRKTRQQHLFVWIGNRYGTFVARIFAAIIAMQLFFIATATLRDTSYWTNISYLPKTPNLVLVAALSIVCFYSAYSGIRTIAYVNGILLPFVVLFGWFVAISNMPHKDYSLLFPVLEHGWKPVLNGMVYAGAGFIELTLILLIQHRVKSKIRFWPLLTELLLFANLTLSPLTGAIAEFGPNEGAFLRFPAFEEWRLVTFGHYLEHVDFLSIYQWMVGAFIRISFAMFLIPEMFNIPLGNKRGWFLLGLFLGSIGITQVPYSDMQFFRFLETFFLPFSLIFTAAVSLTIGGLVLFDGKLKAVKQ